MNLHIHKPRMMMSSARDWRQAVRHHRIHPGERRKVLWSPNNDPVHPVTVAGGVADEIDIVRGS
jgi:hypothetical protein